MIAFARELLCEVVQEAQPLIELHYAEMVRHKEVIKLRPQWAQYAHLEQGGTFCVLTMRNEGRLVAYNAFHLIRHLQDEGFTQAMNAGIYVLPESRNGSTVKRFLRYCDEALKERGAQQIVYMCSPENNLAAILHHIGFADEQVMVAKMI